MLKRYRAQNFSIDLSPVYDGAGLIREALQVHYWMWRGALLVMTGTDVSETCSIADRLENCNPSAGVSVAVAPT